MTRLIATFGLLAGAIVALGQLSAAQWQGIGVALLALTLRYGMTVLPWALSFLFAGLWWRQREITQAFRDGYLDKIVNPTRRKRATRWHHSPS